jgi:sulfur relay (sulfurtransferase) complex TusBCD TusD component (DsrE family)
MIKYEVNMFFMGDSIVCAMKNQKTPDGYYNLERMVKAVGRKMVVYSYAGLVWMQEV